MMDTPLAYFIIFTCYGTWSHGDERGSVDKEHNRWGDAFLPADPYRRAREQRALRDPPYYLDQARRRVVLTAILDVARRKGWQLHAVHVRSNHVHVVVTTSGSPERVMNDVKAAASRCLNKVFPEESERKRWTRHGSTRYLWAEEDVMQKVNYVLDEQGEAMERFPEASASPAGTQHAPGLK